MAKQKGAKKNPNHRPNVGAKLKQALIKEAGFKCANPGCPNALVELHHIKEWHVYKRHDQGDMIAICPTCHSHAHHGRLNIDDATIRSWKRIPRTKQPRGHIYIEPSKRVSIVLGTLLFTSDQVGPRSTTVFELSSHNRLGFRVAGTDIIHLSLSVSDSSGRLVLEVVDGHVNHSTEPSIQYESRPGRVRVTAPATTDYLPDEVVSQCFGPNCPAQLDNGRFTIVDVEVMEPGKVRVQGVWVEGNRGIVVGRGMLSITTNGADGKLGFVHFAGYQDHRGDGGIATINLTGPITQESMFSLLFRRPEM